MAQPKLYKIIGHEGKAINGGSGEWFLPKGKRPGKWMPEIKGELKPCANGYHLCRRGDLVEWLTEGRIFEAEHRGELVKDDNKVVVGQARLIRELNWGDRTARLFAADCAERVLHIYEKEYPNDSRVRNCIEIARQVANGDLPVSELTAARNAAWAAAGAAASDAASDAARSAARTAAWAAASDAASDAAWAAAGTAAWDAAWAAARNAAWAAAGAAAGNAAGAAAGAAARNAAGAAAGNAAGAAAGAAERKWQTKRLFTYLESE